MLAGGTLFWELSHDRYGSGGKGGRPVRFRFTEGSGNDPGRNTIPPQGPPSPHSNGIISSAALLSMQTDASLCSATTCRVRPPGFGAW